MNRALTYIAILLAILVVVFHFVSLGSGFLVPLLAIAVILLAIGSVTGT